MNNKWLAIGAGFAACLPPAQAMAARDDSSKLECSNVAGRTLDKISSGQFAEAARSFSDEAAPSHSQDQLRRVWGELVARSGQFVRRGSASSLSTGGHDYLLTRMDFASANWDAISACDRPDRLSYLEWAPASDASDRIARAKASSLPGGIVVRPTSVPSPWGPLPATLTLPRGTGPFPAVVLVSGAGSQDEDASVGPSKPFVDLADGLAKQGIATLRYEKRTRSYPVRAGLDHDFTVDDDVTDDALAALSRLMSDRHIDRRRVFLLGHSLGAMMAPRIALRAHALAGVIMMAAPFEDMITNGLQQTRLVASLSHTPQDELNKSIAGLEAEQKLLADATRRKQVPAGAFMGMPQSWWMSLASYDQVRAASRLQTPLLLLQGGADFQVDPKYNYLDWRRVLGKRTHVKFIEYPGLSHPFLPAGSPPSPADYQKEGHVPAQVVSDLAAWILRQHPTHR